MPVGPEIAKAWGSTECVLDQNGVEVHVLRCKAGFRSSLHCHPVRSSRLMCLSGLIEIWGKSPGESWVRRVRVLTPGASVDFQPHVFHEFRVIESGLAVEMYWREPLSGDDIYRVPGLEGGPIFGEQPPHA